MASHPGILFRALCWNLFHGRDYPPDPKLFTTRSRLLRSSERNATHVQVNRPLLEEFASWIAGRDWRVALLQEAPPRWLRPLARRTGASGALALTSRNWCPCVRSAVAGWNPDLIASGEGGSNQLLVRAPARIAEVRRLTVVRRPERRRMLWARLELPDLGTLCVAGLHASKLETGNTGADVRAAAERAVQWSGSHPLIFGGDLNVRPEQAKELYRGTLEKRLGLTGALHGSIDQLLTRGLERVEPATRLAPAERELPGPDGLRIRLSDHAPVVATFGMK